jgi:hypothetical protein
MRRTPEPVARRSVTITCHKAERCWRTDALLQCGRRLGVTTGGSAARGSERWGPDCRKLVLVWPRPGIQLRRPPASLHLRRKGKANQCDTPRCPLLMCGDLLVVPRSGFASRLSVTHSPSPRLLRPKRAPLARRRARMTVCCRAAPSRSRWSRVLGRVARHFCCAAYHCAVALQASVVRLIDAPDFSDRAFDDVQLIPFEPRVDSPVAL